MKLIITFILILFCMTSNAKTIVSDKLIGALVQVESNGNSNKIGKLGELGILQIRQCVIDDVNRIYKTTYKIEDVKNNLLAKDICKKYLTYWGNHYKKQTGLTPTNEVLSKIWNGGPNGWKKQELNVVANLDRYWDKVQQYLI